MTSAFGIRPQLENAGDEATRHRAKNKNQTRVDRGLTVDDKEFLADMRTYELDHAPDGWPGVQMCKITRLLNMIDELSFDVVHKRQCCQGCGAYYGVGSHICELDVNGTCKWANT